MQEADFCVLLLPCGRSAHSEAGWMKGNGKKVSYWIYQKIQNQNLCTECMMIT